MIIVNDPEKDIDITKHAVIEASAGAGKTFSILKIIKKIILSDKTENIFSKITAVTYTEKAAGELREKIRNELSESLNSLKDDKESADYNKINYCYENFQDFSVTTIHGFCNKLLTEYSFENKISFENALVNDSSLIEALLNKQLKSYWINMYKENLNFFIEISGFSENPKKFIRSVLDIAEKYKPDFNNLIAPSPVFDHDKIKTIINNLENNIKQLLNFIKSDQKNDNAHFLITYYNKLKKKINSQTVGARMRNIILPLINFFSNKKENDNLKIEFIKLYQQIAGWEKLKKRKSFLLLSEENDGTSIEIEDNELLTFITLLEKIRYSFDDLHLLLLSNTIEKLLIDLKNYKEETSMISYDDMLLHLNKALDNDFFLSEIRKKFKYALFDEFQDTDKIQYEIFKKIFIDSPENKILIIGDPKQSIYGFRNADVYSYIFAKDELINKYNAKLYTLGTNFRSTKKLIDDYNLFFSKWFSDTIEYNEVTASDTGKKIIFNEPKRDGSGITVFDLSGEENNLYPLSRIIINEIKYLLTNNIKIQSNESQKTIDENDIAVLVRTRKEADIIYNALSENNIKSAFYKRSGLYQSNEALTIKYLLKAILNPENETHFKKAFLTEIFNKKVHELFVNDTKPDSISFLFNHWIYLSEKRNWSKLFHSILYDTGFIYRITYEKKTGYERKVINYKHIFEKLEKNALRNKLDIFQLYTYLNSLILNSIDEELDEDYWRIDTDNNKIRIITMHASKGLEFPVVFIFSKFSIQNKYDYFYFHKDNKIVFDLNKKNENKILNDKEIIDEYKRLFYVAATRSIYKLYLPLMLNETNQNTLFELINGITTSIFEKNFFLSFNDYKNIPGKKTIPEDSKSEAVKYDQKELFQKVDFNEIKSRRIALFSYSKLYKDIHLDIPDEINENSYETEIKETDELIHQTIEENILPSSNFTGTMFHKILEKISFKDFDPADSKTSELIKESFKTYFSPNIKKDYNENSKLYIEAISKILYNTFNSEITDANFKLKDIDPDKRLNEVEFFLSLPDKNNKTKIFLNGFIDLVFIHNGKYYLIDWKSNYLKNGYENEVFYSEVKKHYELQYKIYFIAFLEWIKKYIPDFKYNNNFGGIIYLYLRGLDPNASNKGKFYFLPAENEIENIKNEINSLIWKQIQK